MVKDGFLSDYLTFLRSTFSDRQSLESRSILLSSHSAVSFASKASVKLSRQVIVLSRPVPFCSLHLALLPLVPNALTSHHISTSHRHPTPPFFAPTAATTSQNNILRHTTTTTHAGHVLLGKAQPCPNSSHTSCPT